MAELQQANSVRIMLRVAGWLIAPTLLLLVLLRLQGHQSPVGQQPATGASTRKTSIRTSAYNRRHDNISEGITYSRTILELPDNGEDIFKCT